jgi:integrase
VFLDPDGDSGLGVLEGLGMRRKTRHQGVYINDTQAGPRYEIMYRDSAGTKTSRWLDVGCSLDDALNERNKVLGLKYRGHRVVSSSITVRELFEEYMDTQTGHMRETTRHQYEWSFNSQVGKRFNHLKVRDLDVLLVARMVQEMRDKYSPHTIQNCLKPLKGMMDYGIRLGIVHENPVAQLRPQERPKGFAKKMRILNRAEIDLVTKDSLLLATAVFTGLRLGELFRLEWDEINFDKSELYVSVSKTPSGVRTVAVPAFLLQRLAGRALVSPSQPPFAWGASHVRVFASRAHNDLRKALKAAQVEDRVRFHDLRHTFASILIGQGLDVTYVSQQMGHANPAITLKLYAQLFDPVARMSEARVRMEEMFG